jgi:hypothetical protein
LPTGPGEVRSKPFPDLTSVVEAWPTLPEAIKAGILAMVRASGGSVAEQADHDPS